MEKAEHVLVKAAKDEDFAKSFHSLSSSNSSILQNTRTFSLPYSFAAILLNCDVILAPFRGVEVVVVGGLLAIPWNT